MLSGEYDRGNEGTSSLIFIFASCHISGLLRISHALVRHHESALPTAEPYRLKPAYSSITISRRLNLELASIALARNTYMYTESGELETSLGIASKYPACWKFQFFDWSIQLLTSQKRAKIQRERLLYPSLHASGFFAMEVSSCPESGAKKYRGVYTLAL